MDAGERHFQHEAELREPRVKLVPTLRLLQRQLERLFVLLIPHLTEQIPQCIVQAWQPFQFLGYVGQCAFQVLLIEFPFQWRLLQNLHGHRRAPSSLGGVKASRPLTAEVLQEPQWSRISSYRDCRLKNRYGPSRRSGSGCIAAQAWLMAASIPSSTLLEIVLAKFMNRAMLMRVLHCAGRFSQPIFTCRPTSVGQIKMTNGACAP